MNRRRHQHARRGDFGKRGGDVGRKERPTAMHRERPQQRQKNRQLKTVHVLRRHGRDDVRNLIAVQAERSSEKARVVRAARANRRPCLGIRLRLAGAAGSETDRDDLLAIDLGHREVDADLVVVEPVVVESKVQVVRGESLAVCIAERVAAGLPGQHFLDRGRRTRGRQEIGLSAARNSAESDQERIAILAEVHGKGRRRQRRGDGIDVGEESRHRNRAPLTPGESPVWSRDVQQRQRSGCTFDNSRQVPLSLASEYVRPFSTPAVTHARSPR